MSSQSDRDLALERLLRAMPDETGRPTSACLDPERLAAWSDGGLTPAERDAVDTHLASCARCLAMLAAFSAIHEGSLPAHERGLPPRATAGEAERVTHRPARVLRWPVKWVVPITSAAAAVLIWMVLPAQPPEPAFAPATQVARDEAAPVTPGPPPPQRFDAPSGAQVGESATGAPPAAPAQPPRALSKSVEPAAEAERRREQDTATEALRQTPAEEPAAKAADTSAFAGQRAANETAMSDRTAAARPTPAASAPAAPPGATLMRSEVTPIEVRSPDATHRWRILGALVERSADGGSSWQPATIPAGVVVTTGMSPGPDVCWLVGPNGTVIRTANGSRFEAVNIPAAGAIVSIQAADATRATVRDAGGRVYVTQDGGKTWK